MSGRYLLISDMQVPYHDARAVANLIAFTSDFKPERVYSVGDELDSPEPSRWNRGMAGEYAGTFQRSLDQCHGVLAAIRAAAGDVPFALSRSNHNDRVEKYVAKYAPALGQLDALRIEKLLRLDDIGVEYLRAPTEIHPGWVLMHGDESGIVQTAGGTALSLARKLGKSVVCGHTHRAGVQHETRGMSGHWRTIWGVEVGHLMDGRKATYLRSGSANWAQAFGLLYADGSKVTPVLVPVMPDGSFTVEGRRWG